LAGTFEKFGWDSAEPEKNSAAARRMPKNSARRLVAAAAEGSISCMNCDQTALD